MKELMDLLTRVVVAFEKIAEPEKKGCGGDCKCEKTETLEPIKEVERDYDIIASQPGGREVLIDMCKTKGIEVPKGVRTTTIAKLLKEGPPLTENDCCTCEPGSTIACFCNDKKDEEVELDKEAEEVGILIPKEEVEEEQTKPVEDFKDEQHKDKVEIDSKEGDDGWGGDEWPE